MQEMVMFRMRRFLLDAGSTGGDAGGTGTQGGANTGTPPVSGGNQGAGAEARFSQADMDRIIGERLARAEAAATEKLLKSLGVEKVEDAAAVLKKQRDADEAAKTELQKAADAKAKAESDAATLKQQLEAERNARIEDRRNAKIEAAATAAGAIDAADVLTWAERSAADLIAKAVKDDGTVDEAAIKSLIEKATKDKPHFFGQQGQQRQPRTPGSPSNAGGKNPPNPQQSRFGDKPLVTL